MGAITHPVNIKIKAIDDITRPLTRMMAGLSNITKRLNFNFKIPKIDISKAQNKLNQLNLKKAEKTVSANLSGMQSRIDSLNAGNALNRIQSAFKAIKLPIPSFPSFKLALPKFNASKIQTKLDRINLDKAQRQINNGVENVQSKINALNAGNAPNRIQTAFNQSFKNITNSVKALKSSIESAANVHLAATGIEDVGKKLTSALSSPIAVASEFEAQMSRVGAVALVGTLDAAGQKTAEFQKQFTLLTTEARRLGATTAWAATQAGQGMQLLGTAGFTTKEIIAGMPAVLATASAGDSTLKETANVLSNVGSAFFGVRGAAAQMNRIGDVITHTFTSSNTTLSSLSETLKYVAPIASKAGMSLEETSAVAGILGNIGISGSQAGTTLRQLTTRMAALPKPTREAFNSLNISTEDSEGNLKNIIGIMKEVAIAMDAQNLGSAKRLDLLKKLSGQTAISGGAELFAASDEMLKYIDSFGIVNEKTGEGLKVAGKAKQVAKLQLDNLKGSVTILKSAWESLNITLGNVFLPLLRKIVDTIIIPLVTKIDLWAAKHQKLVKGVLLFVGVLSTAAIATATFLKVISAINLTLGVLKVGIVGVSSFAIPLLALTGIGLLLYKNWEPVKAFFKGFGQGLITGFAPAFKALGGLKEIFAPLVALFSKLFQPISRTEKGLDQISSTGQKIGIVVGSALGGIVNIISIAVKGLHLFVIGLQQIGDWLGNTAAKFSQLTVGLSIVEKIQYAFLAAGHFIANINFAESGKAIIRTLAQGISFAGKEIWNALVNVFQKVRNLLPFSDAREGPLSSLFLSGKKIILTIIDGILSVSNAIVNAVKKIFNETKKILAGFLSSLFLSGQEVILTIANGIISLKNKIYEGLVHAFSEAFSFLESFSTIFKLLIIGSILRINQELATKLKTIFGSITVWFNSLFQKLIQSTTTNTKTVVAPLAGFASKLLGIFKLATSALGLTLLFLYNFRQELYAAGKALFQLDFKAFVGNLYKIFERLKQDVSNFFGEIAEAIKENIDPSLFITIISPFLLMGNIFKPIGSAIVGIISKSKILLPSLSKIFNVIKIGFGIFSGISGGISKTLITISAVTMGFNAITQTITKLLGPFTILLSKISMPLKIILSIGGALIYLSHNFESTMTKLGGFGKVIIGIYENLTNFQKQIITVLSFTGIGIIFNAIRAIYAFKDDLIVAAKSIMAWWDKLDHRLKLVFGIITILALAIPVAFAIAGSGFALPLALLATFHDKVVNIIKFIHEKLSGLGVIGNLIGGALLIGLTGAATAGMAAFVKHFLALKKAKACEKNPILACMLPDKKELVKRIKEGKKGWELIGQSKTECPMSNCVDKAIASTKAVASHRIASTKKINDIVKLSNTQLYRSFLLTGNKAIDKQTTVQRSRFQNVINGIKKSYTSLFSWLGQQWGKTSNAAKAGTANITSKYKNYVERAKATGTLKREGGKKARSVAASRGLKYTRKNYSKFDKTQGLGNLPPRPGQQVHVNPKIANLSQTMGFKKAWKEVKSKRTWMQEFVLAPYKTVVKSIKTSTRKTTDFIKKQWNATGQATKSILSKISDTATAKIGKGLSKLNQSFTRLETRQLKGATLDKFNKTLRDVRQNTTQTTKHINTSFAKSANKIGENSNQIKAAFFNNFDAISEKARNTRTSIQAGINKNSHPNVSKPSVPSKPSMGMGNFGQALKETQERANKAANGISKAFDESTKQIKTNNNDIRHSFSNTFATIQEKAKKTKSSLSGLFSPGPKTDSPSPPTSGSKPSPMGGGKAAGIGTGFGLAMQEVQQRTTQTTQHLNKQFSDSTKKIEKNSKDIKSHFTHAFAAISEKAKTTQASLSRLTGGKKTETDTETKPKSKMGGGKAAGIGAGMAVATGLLMASFPGPSEASQLDTVTGAVTRTTESVGVLTQALNFGKTAWQMLKDNIEMIGMVGLTLLGTGLIDIGAMLPMLAKGVGIAAVAFAAWKIGEWAYNNIQPVQDAAIEFVGYFVRLGKSIQSIGLAATFATLGDSIRTTLNNMFGGLGTLVMAPITLIGNMITILGETLGQVIAAISQGDWAKIGGIIINGMSSGISAISTFLLSIGTGIITTLATLGSIFIENISLLGQMIKSGLNNAWGGLGDIVMAPVTLIGNMITILGETLGQVIAAISLGDWAGAGGAIIGGIIDGIKASLQFIITMGTGIIKLLITGITTAISSLLPASGAAFIETFKEGLIAKVEGLKLVIMETLQSIRDMLPFSNAKTGPLSNLFTSGQRFLETFMAGFKSVVGKAKTGIKTALQSIRSFLPFSDAQQGPLADLTLSGSRLLPTFMGGVLQSMGVVGPIMDKALSKTTESIDIIPQITPKVDIPKLPTLDDVTQLITSKVDIPKLPTLDDVTQLITPKVDIPKLPTLDDVTQLITPKVDIPKLPTLDDVTQLITSKVDMPKLPTLDDVTQLITPKVDMPKLDNTRLSLDEQQPLKWQKTETKPNETKPESTQNISETKISNTSSTPVNISFGDIVINANSNNKEENPFDLLKIGDEIRKHLETVLQDETRKYMTDFQ